MSKELSVPDVTATFDEMNQVAELMLKGASVKDIAGQLNITRVAVMDHQARWKAMTVANGSNLERAREALAAADQHYTMLLSRAWETVEQADQTSQLAIKANAIKLAADIETKRMEMLNKAGVLENSDLAQQVLDTERKQQQLISILKEVTNKCDHCKHEVAKRLSDITNTVEAITIT